jgi:hypothetical protein
MLETGSEHDGMFSKLTMTAKRRIPAGLQLTVCVPGVTIQEVSTVRVFITEQILPIEQGEKETSLLDVVGCMMY